MKKNLNVEEACGYKQLYNLSEIEGKTVLGSEVQYSRLYIIFSDKTFIAIHSDYSEEGETAIFINSELSNTPYDILFDPILPENGDWDEIKDIKLSNIGKIMNADIDKIRDMYLNERDNIKKDRENSEYQQYLRLKEKYEGKQ